MCSDYILISKEGIECTYLVEHAMALGTEGVMQKQHTLHAEFLKHFQYCR